MIPAVQNDKSLLEEHKFYQNTDHSLGCFSSVGDLFKLNNLLNVIILSIVLFAIYRFVKFFIRRNRTINNERTLEKLCPV